ncbi:glycosyltransferase family 4 protein [bacterium]|jgi:glycosyltransferase involved in cell wall biosynthesis|nr:glycosyltransferase family 4 protein [bacterium]
MKILIAAGIFIPEVGGPATYISNLAKEFVKLGHKVSVVTYSDQDFYDIDDNLSYKVFRIKRKNKLSNYFRYYKKLKDVNKKESIDLLYAFDHFSAGIPASLLAKKIKKPLVIRVGGDFLWEKMVNLGKINIPLHKYYSTNKNIKEKIYLNIFQRVFIRANKIIFNTQWQQDLYEANFILNKKNNSVIHNFFVKNNLENKNINSDEIIFAGRFIKLKNIENLIKAFSQIKTNKKLILIGDGPEKNNLKNLIKNYTNIKIEAPLPVDKLLKRISGCYAFVLPSLSELSPNVALEALSLGKAVILTKNNGLPAELKKYFYLINPEAINEITKAINFLLEDKNYQDFLQKIELCIFDNSWSKITHDHIKLFKSL